MLPPKLQDLRQRTGMYIQNVSYDTVTACIQGYDLGSETDLLKGFREWLRMQAHEGHNMHWPNLVLFIAFSDSDSPLKELLDRENHERAIQCLFDKLDEFLGEKEELGLQPILDRHNAWESERKTRRNL